MSDTPNSSEAVDGGKFKELTHADSEQLVDDSADSEPDNDIQSRIEKPSSSEEGKY